MVGATYPLGGDGWRNVPLERPGSRAPEPEAATPAATMPEPYRAAGRSPGPAELTGGKHVGSDQRGFIGRGAGLVEPVEVTERVSLPG
jgi:hypothetical protein